MEPMTLREASQRTSRSITTLRRYIRSGRLDAEKRQGRFGPEYFVSEKALIDAGLETDPDGGSTGLARRRRGLGELPASNSNSERAKSLSVPLSLFEELQMKHEQLLVQYGMVRAGGIRLFELKADVEAKQRELEESRSASLQSDQRLTEENVRLKKQLRQSELEQQGQGLEIAALREKVRALEMLTRNAITNESIEKQFSQVMSQKRRVERMTSRGEGGTAERESWRDHRPEEPEH
ncbi:MAG: hypothetical protein GY723_00610 [bacterium]|nr:hypothetical protein [bacterium]